MKSRNLVHLTNALVSGALLAGALVSASTHASTTLRFSSMVPSVNPLFTCSVEPLLEDLKALGTVRIEEYFGGGSFGAPDRQWTQAERGITDMAWGITSYNEGQFLLTELVTLPTMMEDHELATQVLNEKILPEYLQRELGDVKLINLWVAAPLQFYMRSSADPADLGGARIATGARMAPFLRTLGGQVTTIPLPSYYENLERGVMDGAIGTWATARAARLDEVTRYVYEVNFGTSIGFTAMNRRTYDRLPDDVKAVIDEHAGMKSSMHTARCFTEITQRVKEASRDRLEIVDLTQEKREEITAKVQPAIEAELERLESRGLPAREIYELIRAEAAAASEQ